MGNLNNFDSDNHELPPNEPVPPGNYRIAVIDSEIKQAKTGAGSYLQLVWTILEGEYQGRKIFTRYTVTHPNEDAMKTGLGILSRVCKALGKPRINDSGELHDIPTTAKVVTKPGRGGWGPSNEIASFVGSDAQVGAPSRTLPPRAAAPSPIAPAARKAWGSGAKKEVGPIAEKPVDYGEVPF